MIKTKGSRLAQAVDAAAAHDMLFKIGKAAKHGIAYKLKTKDE